LLGSAFPRRYVLLRGAPLPAQRTGGPPGAAYPPFVPPDPGDWFRRERSAPAAVISHSRVGFRRCVRDQSPVDVRPSSSNPAAPTRPVPNFTYPHGAPLTIDLDLSPPVTLRVLRRPTVPDLRVRGRASEPPWAAGTYVLHPAQRQKTPRVAGQLKPDHGNFAFCAAGAGGSGWTRPMNAHECRRPIARVNPRRKKTGSASVPERG